MTYGKQENVRTINAPLNPDNPGCQDTQANADKYEGIARGRENAIVRAVRPMIPDMEITHATNVPRKTLAIVTEPARTELRMISDRVRC
jgi:hypothetical protein